MANYATLLAAIRAAIKANDQQAITGDVLQAVLTNIVGTLGAGYQFAGVATPTTNPGTPDGKVWYLAPAGSYPNFGATVAAPYVVPAGSIGVFAWSDTWTRQTIEVASVIPDVITYAECTTPAATVAKVVAADNFRLVPGVQFRVKFSEVNTAANPTLNIGGTGALPIVYDSEAASATNSWEAGEVVLVYYDGTSWQASAAQGGGGTFASGEKVNDTAITDVVEEGSKALMTSGGVFSKFAKVPQRVGILQNAAIDVSNGTIVPTSTYNTVIFRALGAGSVDFRSIVSSIAYSTVGFFDAMPAMGGTALSYVAGRATQVNNVVDVVEGQYIAVSYNKAGQLELSEVVALTDLDPIDVLDGCAIDVSTNKIVTSDRYKVAVFLAPNRILAKAVGGYVTVGHFANTPVLGDMAESIDFSQGDNPSVLTDISGNGYIAVSYVGSSTLTVTQVTTMAEYPVQISKVLSEQIDGLEKDIEDIYSIIGGGGDIEPLGVIGMASINVSNGVIVSSSQDWQVFKYFAKKDSKVTINALYPVERYLTYGIYESEPFVNSRAVSYVPTMGTQFTLDVTLQNGQYLAVAVYTQATQYNVTTEGGGVENEGEPYPRYIGTSQSFTHRLDSVVNADALQFAVGVIGKATVGDVESGATTTSVADAKFVTYENGQPIIEDNCVFVTCSTRTTYCGALIYKLHLDTYRMELVGNIMYRNSGVYHAHYIASSLMFDRNVHKWVVTTDFWDGDAKMYMGLSVEDLRYGYNIVDVALINCESPTTGDEDQAIYYDDDTQSPLYGKYILLHTRTAGAYQIILQTADAVDGHYTIYARTNGDVSYTGCCLQRVGGTPYIITGTRIGSGAADKYRVMSYPALNYIGDLQLDKPTGGTGGWGSFAAVPSQNETQYIMITFDRGLTSNYDNWTYGTTHIYASRERNSGLEYPIKAIDGALIPANITAQYGPTQLHMERKEAMTHYLTEFLAFNGFRPRYVVNRNNSNELPVTNVSISNLDNNRVSFTANGQGYGSIAPYNPLTAYRMRVYMDTGETQFVIATADFSQYRKCAFVIDKSKFTVAIKVVDNFANQGSPVSQNLSSFICTRDYFDAIIGVNPYSLSIFVVF